jgi:hypothetical protein
MLLSGNAAWLQHSSVVSAGRNMACPNNDIHLFKQQRCDVPRCAMLCAVQMHGPQAGLVLAPHLYPPSITWNPAESPNAAAARWNLSWALKWLGLDTQTLRYGNALRMRHAHVLS